MKDSDSIKLSLKKTEQVEDIIDRMPTQGTKWVLYIVFGLVIIMFGFGFIVKYPEVVSGEITITMKNAPLRMVSKSSGRLLLLKSEPRVELRTNEIFALIDNPTDLSDLLLADSLLTVFSNEQVIDFPDTLNLGELNNSYYNFIDSYRLLREFKRSNVFEMREQAYQIQLESSQVSLDHNKEKCELKKEQLDFYNREIKRDSLDHTIGGTIYRTVDKSKSNYNSMQESYIGIVENIAALELKVEEIKTQIAQLKIEYKEKEQNLKISFRSNLNSLYADISQWKDKYAFIAPFDGTLEFLDFWHNNDFVQAGKEVFSVLPEENNVYGYLLLPSVGAGKVKEGQLVNIQLNDYPYLEYGTLQGYVQTISLMTNKIRASSDKMIDTYLVTISLPKGLTTKFGSTLDFKYEIKGNADVQTRKRRLVERLFDNLKYITN